MANEEKDPNSDAVVIEQVAIVNKPEKPDEVTLIPVKPHQHPHPSIKPTKPIGIVSPNPDVVVIEQVAIVNKPEKPDVGFIETTHKPNRPPPTKPTPKPQPIIGLYTSI